MPSEQSPIVVWHILTVPH